MKVLFAVSNEKISEAIVKKYQKDYKEIISYKNVYYFNAILKEIQRDKTYDRIVISEDLEPFANNDYEAIDKFIFEKLDNISDEATDRDGGDTPIILICSDRRAKSEQLLVKLFGIGVYSALLGQDRSIQQVCELIKKPRTKKEAKIYYKIESDEVGYQAENEDSVSEVEIQNILMHYKKLGKDEDAYVESFNRIAAQYTDTQLKLIIKFLPINVKAVLETQSQKYQEIMAFAGTTNQYKPRTIKKEEEKQEKLKINFIENQLNKEKNIKQVIVPSAVDTKNVKKLNKKVQEEVIQPRPIEKMEEEIKTQYEEPEVQEESVQLPEVEEVVEPPKRKRGRPKKVQEPQEEQNVQPEAPKRKRGRPRKVDNVVNEEEKENKEIEDVLDEILPGFDSSNEIEERVTTLPGTEDEEDTSLDNSNEMLPGIDDEEKDVLPGFEYVDRDTYSEQEPIPTRLETDSYTSSSNNSYTNTYINNDSTNEILNNVSSNTCNIESLLTRDKKIVAFVGTTKNGTSFIVNNLAQVFADMGIKTAILDITKNKNSYYIYTKNEEQLRNIAYSSITNLEKGMVQGIPASKNLTVFTSLPTEIEKVNVDAVLESLVKSYSLVLIDCDFDTPVEYFKIAQEVYLVQSMDILTIQPLTSFLRELKAKNVLDTEKFRVVINKATKVRSLNPKVIIGGISYYNDPAMSFITELFNKDKLKYSIVPFDEQVYVKYLEGLVECKISLSGYPKNFMTGLKELANNVYPLLSNKYKPVENYKPRQAFSDDMNSTLARMKKKY